MFTTRSRSVPLVAGIAMLILAGTATAASAAGGSAGTVAAACPSRALCLYEGTNFTGAVFSVTSLNPAGTCVSLVDHGWGDRAHSAINTHSRGAAMFANDDCIGGPFQVPANSSVADFGGFTPESVWVPSS